MEQNVPAFLQEKLILQYGREITNKILDGYTQKRPVTLRINTLKANYNEIAKELEQNNIIFKNVAYYKEALIIKNVQEDKIKKLKSYEEGKIYLQSLSSMLPAIILEPKAQENILDMTAAPGGKTTQLATISQNEALITACEKNKIRAERLKYNITKQGATCVNVLVQDARNLSDFFSFDKILLDAPCSGSGTLESSNKKLNEIFTEELVERSQKIQKQLLTKALSMLKTGNEMVYSTCSILQEENEKHIQQLLEKGKIEIVPIEPQVLAVGDEEDGILYLPVKIPGTLCVCPNELYEGFFIAKIKKIK